MKPPRALEQIVEPLFGVDSVERIGTNTRLSRVEAVQVPGSTATELEPVAVVTSVSVAGPPVVLSPSSWMKLRGG